MSIWIIILKFKLQDVQLGFESFELEPHASCRYDYIKVFDGMDQGGSYLGKYCGSTSPAALQSHSGALFIEFVSDANSFTARNGFMLMWQPAGRYHYIDNEQIICM